MQNKRKIKPPAARGTLFEKTAPLDPPQKLLIKICFTLYPCNHAFIHPCIIKEFS